MTRLFLVAALSLTACAGNEGDDHDHDHDDDLVMNYERTATTDGGTWDVAYTPSMDPIAQSENFSITVTLSGDAVEGAELRNWDVSMPAHGHGMNTEATVAANEDGTYTVDGMLLHMPGHWRMVADVTNGDVTESATFDVDCCGE